MLYIQTEKRITAAESERLTSRRIQGLGRYDTVSRRSADRKKDREEERQRDRERERGREAERQRERDRLGWGIFSLRREVVPLCFKDNLYVAPG